ncbi:hypothetical protein [Longispora fulva]|uniref:Uncharacterized protein n=1 Tax=Longispora fulva TaxID=619741 RepID=A0A8J7GST0_9ACTN|nr:hypothetical protein [Longispora fulva]MBG6139220.1 hypothetical protein [Longispora fulva]
MPASDTQQGRLSGGLPTILFWIGVGLAPVAAALLLLSQGGGPLRVAAALAILSIVLIGLSITLRRDNGAVSAEMEATLVEELELLREDVRDDIRTAAKATHAALLREVQTLRGEVDALRGGRPQPGPVTATAAVPAPGAGVVHHTETVQVTTRQTTLTADHPHGRATPYPPADEARRPEPDPRFEGRRAEPAQPDVARRPGNEYGARPALETSRIEPSTVLGPRPEPARAAEYGRRVEDDRPRWEPEPVRARVAEEPVGRARIVDDGPAVGWQPPAPTGRYDDSTSVSRYGSSPRADGPARADGDGRWDGEGRRADDGRRADGDGRRALPEPARFESEPRPAGFDAPRWADGESRRSEPEPARFDSDPRRVDSDPRRADIDPRRAEPEPRRSEPGPRWADADQRRPDTGPRWADGDGRRAEPEMDGPTRNRRAARRAEPDDEPGFAANLPAIPRGNDPWADLRSDAPGSTRSAGESWAEVRSDERGGELRMGERRAELRTDEYGQELRVADRWASIRQEPADQDRPGRRAAADWDDHQPQATDVPGWRNQDSGGDERTTSGWTPPRDYDDTGYRSRHTEEPRGWQPPQEDYPREERWR